MSDNTITGMTSDELAFQKWLRPFFARAFHYQSTYEGKSVVIFHEKEHFTDAEGSPQTSILKNTVFLLDRKGGFRQLTTRYCHHSINADAPTSYYQLIDTHDSNQEYHLYVRGHAMTLVAVPTANHPVDSFESLLVSTPLPHFTGLELEMKTPEELAQYVFWPARPELIPLVLANIPGDEGMDYLYFATDPSEENSVLYVGPTGGGWQPIVLQKQPVVSLSITNQQGGFRLHTLAGRLIVSDRGARTGTWFADGSDHAFIVMLADLSDLQTQRLLAAIQLQDS